MGKTVGELQQCMSYQEFVYWQAFNLIEPIGIAREDYLQANVSKSVIDAAFPKNGFGLDDFRLFKPVVEQSPDDLRNQIKAFFAMRKVNS